MIPPGIVRGDPPPALSGTEFTHLSQVPVLLQEYSWSFIDEALAIAITGLGMYFLVKGSIGLGEAKTA